MSAIHTIWVYTSPIESCLIVKRQPFQYQIQSLDIASAHTVVQYVPGYQIPMPHWDWIYVDTCRLRVYAGFLDKQYDITDIYYTEWMPPDSISNYRHV